MAQEAALRLAQGLIDRIQTDLNKLAATRANWPGETEEQKTNRLHQEWVTQNGLVGRDEYQTKLGLSYKEFEAARELGIIRGVEAPIGQRKGSRREPEYFADKPLNEEELAQIAYHTLLSKEEAIKRLGISAYQFEKLRKQKELKVASQITTSNGYLANLYRQLEIDRLLDPLDKTNWKLVE